jgi:hypothetical protein
MENLRVYDLLLLTYTVISSYDRNSVKIACSEYD